MIRLWTHSSVNGATQPFPVIFTEDNWSNNPHVTADAGNVQYCSDPNGCEGAYLADLMTWLYDMRYAPSGSYLTAFQPLRVAWFRGANRDIDPKAGILGLYTNGGGKKPFHISVCGSTHSTFDTDGLTVQTTPTNANMPDYYNKLRYAACY